MQTVILCGGYGTRMGSVAGRLPKPMLRVGGQPLLWHIMSGYAAAGFDSFVLCTGHLGAEIARWVAEAELPWRVRIEDTGVDSPTGERLLRVRHLLTDRFFMTYGDGVSDLDLRGLLAHHLAHGRLATVTATRPRSRFGILDIEEGRVTRFQEKPLMAQRVSGGFFVMEPGVLDELEPGAPLEQGALGRLAQRGELSAFEHDGFWFSVDTPRDLAELEALHAAGRTPWLSS